MKKLIMLSKNNNRWLWRAKTTINPALGVVMGVASSTHHPMLHWMVFSTASTTLLSCSRRRAATVILRRQLPWRKIQQELHRNKILKPNLNQNQSQEMSQNQKQKKTLLKLLHKTNSRTLTEPSGALGFIRIGCWPCSVFALVSWRSSCGPRSPCSPTCKQIQGAGPSSIPIDWKSHERKNQKLFLVPFTQR